MTLEELQEQIKAISESVSTIRSSGLSERALLVLIQHACPAVGRPPKRPSQKLIRQILDGIECLEDFVTEDEE